MSKITVYVLNSCVPGDANPIIPNVYGTEDEAELGAIEMLRNEWESAGICDDETGEPLPYPDDWHDAQDALIEFYGNEWGQWEITAHEISTPAAPDDKVSEIVNAALAVVDNWGEGDLAASVRYLSAVLDSSGYGDTETDEDEATA